MATGYNKQSTYVDGNVITASLFNEDFGALQSAFAYTTDPSTTGHTHDGSAHQGGAISKIGDIDFNNKIEIDGTNNAIKLFIEVGGTTSTEILTLTASALSPSVASIDLGVSSQPFDSAYINSITMPDSDGTTNRINLGAGTDFNIHYNANNTAVLQSTTASSVIDVDGKAGVKLKTDGTERLATTSTGVDVSGAFTVDTDVLVADNTNNRVGIGTSSPSSKLHVSSTDSVSITQTHTDGNTVSLKQSGTGGDVEWRNGNGEALILTGSQTRMIVDSSGNVGIGTDSPNYETHIHEATADADARIQLTNADTGTGTADGFHIIMNGTTAGKQVNLLNREASPLAFWTSDTERMHIDASGNVGIGTSSPESGFHVKNNTGVKVSDSDSTRHLKLTPALSDGTPSIVESTSANGLRLNASGTDASLQLYSNNEEAMRIDSSGRLLIGGTQVQTPSSIDNGIFIQSQTNNEVVGVNLYTNEASNNRRADFFLDDANGIYGMHSTASTGLPDFVVKSGTHERFRVTNAGNVGIGTDNPAQKLDVNGNIRVQGTFPKIEFVDTDNNPDFTLIGGNGSISFYDETNSATRMLIDSSGNVGIGTSSPSAMLDVELGATGTIAEFRGGDSDILQIKNENDSIVFDTRNTASGLAFQMQGTERMRIDSSGNVGIGTTSPANTLTVGDLEASALDQDGTVGIKCNANHKGIILQENSGAEQWSMGVGEAGSLKFYDSDSTTPAVTFEDISGNVGIGTDNPATNLHIAGGSSGTDQALFRTSSGGGGGLQIVCSDLSLANPLWSINTFFGEALAFGDGTNEHMRINSSGNVGIGTDIPTQALDVVGNANISGTITASNVNISTTGSVEDGDLLGQVEFNGEDSGGTQLKYASIRATAADVTPSAAYGQLDFYNIKNGTDTKLMSLSPTALELDTGVALSTGGIVNSTGSTSKLTFDSSGTDVVTITGYQLGETTPNTDLTLRCDKTISLQNVNLSVSGLPHNDVLTVNATTAGENALTFFSKPHYPERTGLPLTTTSSPTPAIGTSDAVFVYDTTKDFDGGQWRLNLENESFQSFNRTLPKTMILESDGNTLRVIDPSFREDPFVTTTISLSGISGLVISKIVAKNGYVLVYMVAQGAAGVVVLLDLIENNAIKYSSSGTLEYYASKNLPTIQKPDSVRYKVKSGYHTMTAIRTAFLSFPILDGKELNSNRPKVRVNLVGQTNSFVSYINKDEFSTSVFIDGTGLHGTNNQERNSVFVSSANSIVELVDDYDFSFTGYSSTSGNKSTLIKISERVASDSTLFRQYGTVEEIEQMSENGLAYLTSYGDEKSLTQLIPLRSLDQHDTSSTSPGLLFSKITESKVSGIVPNKSTGFTALSEIQVNTTSTAISTATNNPKVYQDKDIIMPFVPNLPLYEVTALVATELVGGIGDTSVPLTRFNADVSGPTQLGAYGLPSEITDAGEDQNIIDIDHGSGFSTVATKGFYLSFWIKFANSYTAAANEDIITIGQDDGKQIKIALDSNSLPALYRKDSGTTYSSATLDTPTGTDAPDLTEWTNVTLLKPLGRTGLTRLIINGVEVDSVADIMASTFYDISPTSSDSTIKIITSHKYVLSLVKHYVPIATNADSLTPAMVEKIYELEKPMFGPSTGITYLKPPSNVADKNFVTFNEHTKTLSVVNTAATIEYDGLSSKRVDTSLNRIQPTVAVSSGSNLLVGE